MRCLGSVCQVACVMLLPVAAEAQGLVSYGAAAAAGSTAGTVAGAKLNKAVDEVLGKAGKIAEKAAKDNPVAEPVRAKKKAPPEEIIHVSVIPDASIRPTVKSSRAALPGTVEPPPVSDAPAVVPPPVPIVATPEVLASIQSGVKRDDLGKLGEPAFKMVIPEDGHLVEVYRYRAEGKDVGTVRLTDGVVTAVEGAQR